MGQGCQSPERIGLGLFSDAAAIRDSATVILRLKAIGVDEARVAELAALIRRANALIIQRPNPAAQRKRDGFLDAIRDFVAAEHAEVPLLGLDGAIATMRIAERGHHLILGWRSRCDFTELPLAVRLAATIGRTETELAILRADIEKAITAPGAHLSVPGGVMLTRANGQSLDPNAAHASLVYALGGALKMEAFASRLFDEDGRIVLPALPPVGEAEIYKVGPEAVLGMFWQRWQHCHETARYLDQDIVAIEGDDLPNDADPKVKAFFTREPMINFPDWVANHRSADRESYSAAELMMTTNFSESAKGIGGTVAMLPAEWISAEEVGHSIALSEALGYDVSDDQERLGGLRLVHWVRGLSALSAWAAEQSERTGGILRVSQEDLCDLLERMSLTADEATLFLDAVSFSKESRDLYDAPVVRTEGDWLIIGTAVANQRLSKIIPSMLAARKIVPERKGSAFEERVLKFLTDEGLDARSIKFKRNGEEYQYDVLLRWGACLFLFECKNRGLSNNDPQAAYHFLSEVGADIEQTQRLVQGLKDYPDILANEFGSGSEALTIVPVVLHNDTFQLKGEWEGVYIYDWSALSRFFSEGAFHVTRLHRVNGTPVAVRAPLKRIWKGEKPTPEDLLAEFADPHQLMLFDKLSEWQPSEFQLDEQTVVRDWALIRRPMTEENMAEACGVSVEEVVATLDKGDAQIAELRKKLASVGPGIDND